MLFFVSRNLISLMFSHVFFILYVLHAYNFWSDLKRLFLFVAITLSFQSFCRFWFINFFFTYDASVLSRKTSFSLWISLDLHVILNG